MTTHFDLTKVSRVEVVDSAGRSYVKYGVIACELQLQDDLRTLKIFLTDSEAVKSTTNDC